jgi:hypothetical protein
MKVLKCSFALVAVVAVVTAMSAPSLAVRAQSPTRFDYARVEPYLVRTPVNANEVQERVAYRACLATREQWTCREFLPTPNSREALGAALATMGNEGWELVSAVLEDPSVNRIGLTYVFKRPG